MKLWRGLYGSCFGQAKMEVLAGFRRENLKPGGAATCCCCFFFFFFCRDGEKFRAFYVLFLQKFWLTGKYIKLQYGAFLVPSRVIWLENIETCFTEKRR